MKRILLALALLSLPATAAVDLGAELPQVVLKDGRVLARVRIVRFSEQVVMARTYKDIPWDFEGVYGRDVAWALEHYMNSMNIDVLALSYHHRTLMDKLFSQNVIKRISQTASFPVFTFWR